ncbi:glucose dehydrogenase [FAD, quinone]-like [Copidosoma floridanum]|uniref:glucose dehydrogenase [FAD, quinone]-like n=1 Tax=Copidosoma floridanum TaxID=29053 RepID=UPI0006C9B492|nr:glucose dehydrogenase [FAD, quinone]-like [Copidosoma floridanum]
MYWSLLFLICGYLSFSIVNTCDDYADFGSEDSLRQNIIKLSKNELIFSDDSIPFYDRELNDTTPDDNGEYDFIVIGAGTAGATVASRLSEIKDATVLLIEAGSKEYPIMDIPMMAGFLQLSDKVNWGYKTESSDKFCRGLKESKCSWPRGKVMGGSSVLNFLVATRGHRENYDEWASMSGDKSWSYVEMLKYFIKMENFHIDGEGYYKELHSKDGPLDISRSPYESKLVEAFLEAGNELGYEEVDYNGIEQIGFSLLQNTMIHSERCSTNRAYLHFKEKRQNLFLTRDSHVNKILIDEETKTAYGVEFTKFDKTIIVRAKKEVILCAGTINSPQILMLSGIGPAEHLQDLDINVVVDSPVGENLMDHIMYGGLVFKTNISQTPVEANTFDPNNPSIKEYVTNRNGKLTLAVGFQALAFLNVDNPFIFSGTPNIELIFTSSLGIKDPVLANLLGISENYQNDFVESNVDHSTWTIWPMLTRPKSRGKILLQNADPKTKPKIYPNYFDHPDDVRVMIQGIRNAIELAQTKAFEKYNSELYRIPLPCKDYDYDSDDYWECALRLFACTVYHQSGTCKMGLEDDSTSVVNSKLQVIGVKRLRVADASIMPNIISGHINIPTVAIAEKASDMIKEDWGYSS